MKKFTAFLAIASTALMSTAHAELDTVAVQTGISAAEATGLSVGAMVVATVAALVVVGLVIGLVKKI